MAHQGAGGGRSTGASLMRPVGRPQPLASLFAALGLVLASRPLVAQEPAATAYRATWGDAASVGTAGVLYLLPAALGLPHGAPSCAPCDPATLPSVDRWALHRVSATGDAASDVVLAGVGCSRPHRPCRPQRRHEPLITRIAMQDVELRPTQRGPEVGDG